MQEELIYKYLSGETSAGEERELLKWLKESPENQAYFFEIKAIWNAREGMVCNDVEKEKLLATSLNRLNQSIDQYERKKKSISRKTIGIWSGVAAAVALLLGFFFLTPEYKQADYITHLNNYTDSVEMITLADGSQIWLRENSKLTYPKNFTGEYREVHLEGEAFFHIKTNPKHPFIVHADGELVRVLGTSFNVNTRFRDDIIETILVKGSIELQSPNGEPLRILQPDQRALYSRNAKTLEVNEVDANIMTSWRYGLISLSDVSIRTILQCLEDTYNVVIQMDTIPLKNRRYNFSFKRSKGISEALEQLTFMTGVAAEVNR